MIQHTAVVNIVLLVLASMFFSTQYGETAVLIPEEVPTIFSILYSLLPPVKLGQDSRVGFGFRVGPNIDSQVLLELGPQTNTATLGSRANKRQSQEGIQNPTHKKQMVKKMLEMLKHRLIQDYSENDVSKMRHS